jgi:hypothetical protein
VTEGLAPSEEVLWTGKPVRHPFFDISDVFMGPFSVLWLLGVLFWPPLAGTADPVGIVIRWVFIVFGVYVVLGRLIVRWLLLRGTTYTLTNRRLIVVAKVFGLSFRRSHPFRELPPPRVVERADGTGDVRFSGSTAWRRTGLLRWQRSSPNGPLVIRGIENPNRVDDLIMSVR